MDRLKRGWYQKNKEKRYLYGYSLGNQEIFLYKTQKAMWFQKKETVECDSRIDDFFFVAKFVGRQLEWQKPCEERFSWIEDRNYKITISECPEYFNIRYPEIKQIRIEVEWRSTVTDVVMDSNRMQFLREVIDEKKDFLYNRIYGNTNFKTKVIDLRRVNVRSEF